MSVTTYKNPLYNPSSNLYGPEVYETKSKPAEYRGFLIYERIPGSCWDVVKDGVCVTQMAGPNGARRAIEALREAAKGEVEG